MNPTLLQLFLLANVFLIGVLTALAVRHAYAHFRPPTQHESDKPHPTPQRMNLPPAVKERLLRSSQANFEAILNRSASELQHDLKATSIQLNRQLEKLGAEIVSDEMKRYRESLDKLRQQAEATLGGAQTEIANHQAELKVKLAERQTELEAKLTEDMTAEQQRLVAQIDTKLADAVASFLTETLQHNVDLGAQSAYLTAMLEEHKAELTKGVTDET
ncbi:MAG TPA: hypothetical protein VFM68_00255 [Candidatus Saccharimonadales bacterium]|nr:hypothetical protein [Candidatus Saccharimonadales bacterium]